MDLWTEFEGVTIDSAFALNKLLQSQGRSALFSTVNSNGESVFIRIIECHFDEDEILARWRGVQTLGHPSFLRIDRFGKFLIEEDDITAVYAVFERVDANLGQVLENGSLSVDDATQIGLSIVSALETLHAHGFVHEHVESRNTFAVGDSVKLRSDCIRETPEGVAGFEARRRDAHDLAVVLMQVLLGRPDISQLPARATLPKPFDEIVRKGLSGSWGLAEIKSALDSLKPAEPAPAPKPNRTQAPATDAAQEIGPVPPRSSTPARAEAAEPASAASRTAALRNVPTRPPASLESEAAEDEAHRSPRRWIAPGALLLVVLLFGWMLMRHWRHPHAAPPEATATATHHAAGTPHSAAPAPHARASHPLSASPIPPGTTEWRVVAFTYNRQDQAQKRAASLAQKHPDLTPQVFSPTGKAPWLVTIGGVLERDPAYALARKARTIGLPRDTYAQNYTAR